ncbi:MAG: M20/M25/M40 family metallo-hydrolase [Crenarchaeota archaeon]|nr:M20/M25/M40 family metallo-hydrolase [Thermoproteota archaeon]
MLNLNIDTVVKVFLDIARIYSPSGHERELAGFICNFLRDYVDDVYIDDVGNVIAVKGSGRPVVWLHAHMDTIPIRSEVKILKDMIVGPGVADDKAPLASMMLAVAETEPKCRVVFTGVVEEETTSRGSLHLVESVKNGSLDAPDGVIIGEPTGIDRIVYVYRGSTKMRIVSNARGGHASTPIASSNPILKIYEMYRKLYEILEAGEEYSKISLVPTIVRGGEVPNQIPTHAEMLIDVRIPPGRTCRDVLSKASKLELRDDTSKTYVETYECIDPVQVDIMNPMARAVVRSIVKILGRSPSPAKKWGTSDMNIIVRICRNIIAYGPGEHESTHTDEECVKIEDLYNAVKIYERSIEEFANLVGKH